MDAETTFQFWLAAAQLLAFLAFLGYPLARLANRWSGGSLALPAPLLGLCAAGLLSWYWVTATDLGLEVGVPVMAGLGALAWLPILVGLRARPPRWRAAARAAAPPLALLVAVAVLFTFHFSSVFRIDHLSSAAGANIDVAAYSLVAGHLVDEGLGDTGHIYGYDLSERAEGDAFGATALVGVAAVASGREAWEVGTAVLFVVIFVMALSLLGLIRLLWPQAGLIGALAALAGVANFLFVYLAFEFFLSQIIAIALLCGLVAALLPAVDSGSRRTLAVIAAAVALIEAAMIATYPHMALFAPIVMLPAIAACVPRRAWRQGLIRLGAVAAGGALAAIALAPGQFATAVRRAEALSSIEAGWPLPAFLPNDLFGAVGGNGAGPSAGAWVGSVIIGGVLLGCAVLRGRDDRLARFVIAAWVVVLASYAAVYFREGGGTYRQWKWITTFIPLLVGCGVSLVMAAGVDLARRVRLGPVQARAVALSVLVLVVSLQTARARTWISPWLGGSAPGVYVTADLAQVATDPLVRGSEGVSLNLGDPIETLWAAAILRPRTIFGYPTPAEAGRRWILERAGARPASPGVTVVQLNATYQLTAESRVPSG